MTLTFLQKIITVMQMMIINLFPPAPENQCARMPPPPPPPGDAPEDSDNDDD